MTVEQADIKRRKVDFTYPDTTRNISIFSISSKHPLNVKPGGNALLSGNQYRETKNQQLGYLKNWPDELILELFGYIEDIKTLKNLGLTSRVMYAFTYDEELWKKLYLIKYNSNEPKKWYGSWRSTTLGIPIEEQANLQLPDNLLCSDVLHRPFQCSQINYEKLFSKIIKEEQQYHLDSLEGNLGNIPPGRILRFKEQEMTLECFESLYHDKPFILTNNNKSRWPTWNISNLLSRFFDIKFRQEAMEWSLQVYSNYLQQNFDENPLYLFDCNSKAMTTLKQEYNPPEIFQHDLFNVFKSSKFGNCRPDHAWLIVGPKRSGSTFHKDPNFTSAWNAALTGRKLWIMFPPTITPPGVGTDDEESEVTAPVGVAEWVLSGFFNDCLKIPECQIAITFPGECMYVPSTWWHSVINIDDSVALTQNFVPKPKLTNALNFLKNRSNQLSGFRPNQVKQVFDKFLQINQDDDETIDKIKQYQLKYDQLNLDGNEDCGEISELPPMPIFELFQKLLIKQGKISELNESLKELEMLEQKFNRKGRKWQELTVVSSEQPKFSFGFEESDEE